MHSMDREKYIIYFILFSLILKHPLAASGFTLRKDADGIQVYSRKKADSHLKEFRAVTRVKTSLSSLVSLMKDTASFPKWMHLCTQAEMLQKDNFFERYTYMVNKAPWPMQDRDMIIYSRLKQNKKNGKITIRIEGKKDFIAEKPGLVRVEILLGYYQFTPVGNGEVEIIYQIFTDPGGKLPALVINSQSGDMPFHTLQNMREIVREEKYQNERIPEIHP